MQLNPSELEALTSRIRDGIERSTPPLPLDDTPAFALAFHVNVGAELPFSNGHVSIRFRDFAISGTQTARIAAVDSEHASGLERLRVRWHELVVDGEYEIGAKQAPRIDMDTAGNLMDFDEDDIREGGSDREDDAELPQETQAEMLEHAREERTRLLESQNGQRLVAQHKEHNEIYNRVLVDSAEARRTWKAEGATRDCALHTHAALAKDNRGSMLINDETKRHGTNAVSYNSNAFRQQLMMAMGSALQDPDWTPFGPDLPDPDSKYVKAAMAALTFGHAVESTGNSKSKVRAMTGADVDASVDQGQDPEEATMEEVLNVVAQGMGDGGEAADLAAGRSWRVLDEEDRRFVRRFVFSVTQERAQAETVEVTPLWRGACRARITDASAEIDLRPSGGNIGVDQVRVQLPAFEFELDDSGWSGDVAEMVRERLSEVAFVRSLLHERIRGALMTRLEAVARESTMESNDQ